MKDSVLEYIERHGESTMPMIYLPTISHSHIDKQLRILFKRGALVRRHVVVKEGSSRKQWAYRLPEQDETIHSYDISERHPTSKRLTGKTYSIYDWGERPVDTRVYREPDYATILRTLGTQQIEEVV
jgi:hypothetical protein